jgi:hypothetical protein
MPQRISQSDSGQQAHALSHHRAQSVRTTKRTEFSMGAVPFLDKAFDRPMVPADFAYSPLGALAAIAAGSVVASLLYALTLWPVATLAWLLGAGTARYLGRGPIAELFR